MSTKTDKEKAKAYDEAISKAKDMLNYKKVRQEDMEYLFPELAESEDERIRKNLIELFHDTVSNDEIFNDYGLDKTEVLAWLEKQGEQKASYTAIVETGDGGINSLVTRELPTNGCEEQKPSLSEEDFQRIERIYRRIWAYRKGDTDEIYQIEQDANWLKSIKDRLK